ncbi:P63C domain-containing protein [Azoarcus sp. PA01]|nr:P63C domain-containing protein [Azoarcus sp. PA01]
MNTELTGKAKGGAARQASMTAAQRSEAARNAARAKAEIAKLPRATHGSADHPLKLGTLEIPCYVLEDGRRVLSLGGMVKALGMSIGSAGGGEGDRLYSFATGKAISPFISSDLLSRMSAPIRFQAPTGGSAASGYEATILPDLCDAVLEARKSGSLRHQQVHIAHQCEILVRALARVGIIALIDEATGFQKDRAKDALAKILEAYVAKELQPWVKTFDADYYEEMFRLRGLPYPPDNPNFRPQYFGKLTNDVVYRRLAPGVLDALKQESGKAERKGKLHQHLTAGYGRQHLLKHLGSVVAAMKLSDDWQDFMTKLNRLAPRYGDTLSLDLDEADR